MSSSTAAGLCRDLTVFDRTGLIEKRVRGTNRVIETCRDQGLRLREFAGITSAAVGICGVAVDTRFPVTESLASLTDRANAKAT